MRRLNYCKKIAVAGTVLALFANGMLSYAAETGTITTMSEKIYDDMDDDGTVVGNVIMGSTFSLLDAQFDSEGNVWYRIETDAGVQGYIRSEKVSSSNQTQSGVPVETPNENTQQSENRNSSNNDNSNSNNNVGNDDEDDNTDDTDNTDNDGNEDSEQQVSTKLQVSATQTVNIRKEPSTDAEIVAKMPQGTTVDTIGSYENEDGERWYEVSYIGIEGYVMEKVVETMEVEVTESEIQQESVAQITTAQTVTSQSNNSTVTTTNNTKNNEEEKIEEATATSTTQQEQQTTTKSNKRFHFYIDWVAIFSLIGSLLCIGVIAHLIKTIKKLEK